MISLQSTLAHALDQQGVLPEKFADLALRQRFYEWYQKYVVSGSLLYMFEKRTDPNGDSTTILNTLWAQRKEMIVQTAFEFPDTNSSSSVGILTQSNTNVPKQYLNVAISVSPTKFSANYNNEGRSGSAQTATFKTPQSKIWIRCKFGRNSSGYKCIFTSYSLDGISFVEKHSVSCDFKYLQNIRFSKNYVSLADTKFWLDGVLLFEGLKAQRIEIP